MSTATAEETKNTSLEKASAEVIQLPTDEVSLETRRFELAQRKAAIYAKSDLVPKEYKNNIGNVLIAENMAHRMGADTLMVMQNLYVVHGKPGWSAQFLVGCFNSCGRFSAIKYRFEGEPHTDEWGCVAYCKELATGEVIEGAKITWTMAVAEGWVNKAGSKWKTMPEQMFRYRAATFLIRSTAPEIGLGLLTKEELEDMDEMAAGSLAENTRARMADLAEQLKGDESVDAEIVDEAQPAAEEEELSIDLATDGEDAIDPVEQLRMNVQSQYEEFPKSRQKDLIAGRPMIANMDETQLNEFSAVMRKESQS